MSVAAKRSPISATAEHLFALDNTHTYPGPAILNWAQYAATFSTGIAYTPLKTLQHANKSRELGGAHIRLKLRSAYRAPKKLTVLDPVIPV